MSLEGGGGSGAGLWMGGRGSDAHGAPAILAVLSYPDEWEPG